MDEINIKKIENYEDIFEVKSKRNGFLFWYARDLMETLGYQDFNSFKKSINRAIGICTSLSIPCEENFVGTKRYFENDSKELDDYKLSRFACYLVAMNSDIKKPEVAKAQAYLAKYAEIIVSIQEEIHNIERIELRERLTEEEKILSGIAKAHNIDKYPFFQDAGYRGLYNMSLKDLKRYKGVSEKSKLLDHMGSAEMGANIFRITQTQEKIKKENISGQYELEKTHKEIGKEVRNTMIRMHNTRPEDLPVEKNIKEVKSNLKKAHKNMKGVTKK